MRGGSGINLFYSRRIGLVDGQEVRILGGAKMVGKLGRYYVGVLNMQTDELRYYEDDDEDDDEDGITEELITRNPSNYSVLRMRRDILQRGSIGLMFLNKQETRGDAYNRSFGFDGNLPLSETRCSILGALRISLIR